MSALDSLVNIWLSDTGIEKVWIFFSLFFLRGNGSHQSVSSSPSFQYQSEAALLLQAKGSLCDYNKTQKKILLHLHCSTQTIKCANQRRRPAPDPGLQGFLYGWFWQKGLSFSLLFSCLFWVFGFIAYLMILACVCRFCTDSWASLDVSCGFLIWGVFVFCFYFLYIWNER